jgi:8-oxo-dGTP diphosphatase
MTRYNPHISVDCVVFGYEQKELKVLLINRNETGKQSKFKDKFKLPGNLIIRNQTLSNSAKDVLKEFTGLSNIFLKQFAVFDDPDRINSGTDSEWLQVSSNTLVERVVTIAYYSLIKIDESIQTELSKSYSAQWLSINEIPKLIFDHNRIIEVALETVKRGFLTDPLCFELLPEKFTLNQLQNLYETVLGFELDNRNFRKKISKINYIVPLKEWEKDVSHRPSQLYNFNEKEFNNKEIQNTGLIV